MAAVQATPPEDFPLPAILDPDGEPLAPGSGKCAQLETAVTEISEEMISAIRAHPALVVQCKRHSPNNKVGVNLVRELKGTVAMTNASRGVLITTSFFYQRRKGH